MIGSIGKHFIVCLWDNFQAIMGLQEGRPGYERYEDCNFVYFGEGGVGGLRGAVGGTLNC